MRLTILALSALLSVPMAVDAQMVPAITPHTVPVYIAKPIAETYSALPALTVAALQLRNVEDYGPFLVAHVLETVADMTVGKAATYGLTATLAPTFGQISVHDFQIGPGAAVPVNAPDDLRIVDYRAPIGLYIVQFSSVPRPEWLTALVNTSARVLSYLPDNSYLIALDPSAKFALSVLPFVRQWVVYQPAYKIETSLRQRTAWETPLPVVIRLDGGQSWEALVGDIQAASTNLVSFEPPQPDYEFADIGATLATADIKRFATDSRVLWIEPAVALALSDERACQIVAGHFTASGATSPGAYKAYLSSNGLGDLSRYIVNVIDSGLDYGQPGPLHGDIAGRVTSWQANDWINDVNEKDGTAHGTLVAGLIGGDPTQAGGTGMREPPCSPTCTGFYYGMGIAPTARLRVTDIFNNFNQTTWDATNAYSKLTAASINAFNAGARFENLSFNLYGDSIHPTTQTYDTLAARVDKLVRNSSMLACSAGCSMFVSISAANTDTYHSPVCATCVASPGTAKNAVIMGSSSEARSAGTCGDSVAVNDVSATSARRSSPDSPPTSVTYRIKPDFVAPGAQIVSLYSRYSAGQVPPRAPQPNLGVCPSADSSLIPYVLFHPEQAEYAPSAGTSFAAPIGSGVAVLLSQRFRNLTGTDPSPAMIKAMMAIGADRMIGGHDLKTGQLLTSSPTAQGWGRLNVADLLSAAPPSYFVDEYLGLGPGCPGTGAGCRFSASGQTWTKSLTRVDPTKAVRVALVYTDAPSNSFTGPNRVNELSVYATQSTATYCDGTNYDSSGYTPRIVSPSICGARDRDNTVHYINIAPNSFSGTFQVQVKGDAIVADADPFIDGRGVVDQVWALWVWNAQ